MAAGHAAADVLLAPADLPSTFPADVVALHLGSISLLREPAASTYEALMEREHGRRVLCLDPNIRPGLIVDRDAYLRRLDHWVSLVDVVKVSRADVDWLHPGVPLEDVAAHWLAMGPGLVVITLGSEGARGFGAGAPVEVPGMVVAVADTVGAGDAFTAGLLARLHDDGLLDREALRHLPPAAILSALQQANRVAGSTCTRSGAEPPTSAQLAAATAPD